MDNKETETIKDINKLVDEVIDDDNLDTWDNLSPLEKATMMKKLINIIDKLEKENKVNLNNYISKDKIRDKIDDLIGEQGTGNLAQYIAIGEKLQALREILGE